jgi:uncharacterized protein (PEP-CTERM system associated)
MGADALNAERDALTGRSRVALLAAAAWASSFSVQAQTATGLTVVPSVQVTQTLTNNVNLSPTDKHSEAITRVTAGIAVGSRSGTLRGFLNYGLTAQIYARDSSRNSLNGQNTLGTNADIEVVDGRGFVNVSAAVSQAALSSFSAQTGNDGLNNPNTTEVRTLQVAPRWVGRLGSAVRYSVNGSYNLSSTKSSEVGDSTGGSLNLQVANANASRLGWSVDASRQVSGFGAGRTTSSNRVFGSLSLLVDDLDLRLGANAGREYSDLTNQSQSGAGTWGVNATWTPSPITRVSAQYDERAFGNTYSLNLEYRTPLTVWQLTDSRSLTTSGNQLQAGSRGSVFDLYYAQFASIEPDPLRRVDLVNAFLRSNGIDPSTSVRPGLLTSAATIQDLLSVSVAYRMQRGSATLFITRSKSRRADTLSNAADDLATAGEVDQRTISLNLSHRLTPELSANLNLSTLTGEGTSAAQSNSQRTANLNISGRLTPKSSWSLALRRTLYETSLVPYNESAVIATYSLQL